MTRLLLFIIIIAAAGCSMPSLEEAANTPRPPTRTEQERPSVGLATIPPRLIAETPEIPTPTSSDATNTGAGNAVSSNVTANNPVANNPVANIKTAGEQAPDPTATLFPPQPADNAPGPKEGTWRGITITAEDRCSPYNPDDYPYPQSVEQDIVNSLGGIYGPYTGTWFETTRETDIEHIIARSEAHDSGLCAATPATRRQFASDLLNLTLASPSVNRHQKVANDPSQWLPPFNQCWYVDRVVQVRLEYGLTIDRQEADTADRVLADCQSTEMVFLNPGTAGTAAGTTAGTTTGTPVPGTNSDALTMYDDNGNGRITCAEARAHGIAPVRRGHPAYRHMQDGDSDGMVCE